MNKNMTPNMVKIIKKFKPFALMLSALLLSGCYIGESVVTPDRNITIEDTHGRKLTGYDIYIYRCLGFGSQMDQVFVFKDQTDSTFHLHQQTEKKLKEVGGVWLAPDFYVSYEQEPYWVACVSKDGFEDRRWGLGELQGKDVTIELKEKGAPKNIGDEDFCHAAKLECSACKNHEYFMYEPMRFRGCNSPVNPRPISSSSITKPILQSEPNR